MKLETAKALKEAGWNKETEKVWIIFRDGSSGLFCLHENIHSLNRVTSWYFTPSLEELLTEMPKRVKGKQTEFMFNLRKTGYYEATYINNSGQYWKHIAIDPDPCEAVANLYLKLKQEGIIK